MVDYVTCDRWGGILMFTSGAVKFGISLLALHLFSVTVSIAGVVEDNWYKLSISNGGEVANVGYGKEQVTSVETPHGIIWEITFNTVIQIPNGEGGTLQIEASESEVSEDSGVVTKWTTSLSINGSLEFRETYSIDDKEVIYEIESLEGGKETVTFTLPDQLLSYRIIEERLASDIQKVGETLDVVELPSLENLESTDCWAKYYYEGVVPVEVSGKEIRLRKFRYEGEMPSEEYFNLNGDLQLFVASMGGVEVRATLTSKTDARETWVTQLEDNQSALRVADALNLLASFYFVIENSKRFDYVDSAIVNNVLHDQFPEELEDILKRLIHLCEQGRIALESEGLVDNEHQRKLNATALNFGARAGTALAMEDPASFLFASFEALQDVQKAGDEKTRKKQAVYQQYEHRIKVDRYELSTLRDKLQKKYNIPDGYLVTYEALEEIHKASTEQNAQSRIRKLSNLAEKYPNYAPLNLAIATALFYTPGGVDDSSFGPSLMDAIDNQNFVLRADPTAVNALQLWGIFTMINAWHQTPVYPDLKAAGEELEIIADAGLKIDPSISEFHLFKGVSMLLKDPRSVTNEAWNLIATRSADIADINLQMLRYQWAIVFMGLDEDNRPDSEYRSAIRTLFNYGFTDIESLIKSAGIKRAPERNRMLRDEVKPKFSWGISDDWLWDDITIKNESPFPLTNVEILVTLRNADSVDFRIGPSFNSVPALGSSVVKEFKCDFIDSNSSYVWKDVLKKSEGEWQARYSIITLTCDQGYGKVIINKNE